jgi:hypothetical protein
MGNLRNTQAGFLQDASTLIENALSLPEIAAVLAVYGYDEVRLEEGRRLWREADALAKKQLMEHGGKREASQELGKSWENAHAAYMKTLKVARVAFGDEARAITALGLYGPRKQTISGWLEQASILYTNLEGDPALAARLARFGYSDAKLAAEAALVAEVRAKSLAQTQGTGAAQTATAARDKKLRELDNWISEFRTICRVAFYENPQELEKLGVLVQNAPRRAKKAEASAAPAGG